MPSETSRSSSPASRTSICIATSRSVGSRCGSTAPTPAGARPSATRWIAASATRSGFYRDHAGAQCGMEVVLANGEVMRTGMGALPNGARMAGVQVRVRPRSGRPLPAGQLRHRDQDGPAPNAAARALAQRSRDRAEAPRPRRARQHRQLSQRSLHDRRPVVRQPAARAARQHRVPRSGDAPRRRERSGDGPARGGGELALVAGGAAVLRLGAHDARELGVREGARRARIFPARGSSTANRSRCRSRASRSSKTTGPYPTNMRRNVTQGVPSLGIWKNLGRTEAAPDSWAQGHVGLFAVLPRTAEAVFDAQHVFATR